MSSLLAKDRVRDNVLTQMDTMERRLRILEEAGGGASGPGAASAGSGIGGTGLVLISVSDLESGYLIGKLAANSPLVLGQAYVGGNESLVIDMSAHLTPNAHHDPVTAGNGIAITGQVVSLNTPGSLSAVSVNTAVGSHTHAVTASANPGATSSLLKTDSGGSLMLRSLSIVTDMTVGGELTLDGPLIHNADLEIVAGDILLNASAISSSTWSYGNSGWGIDNAQGVGDFRGLTVDELTVDVFIANATLALAGSEFITKSSGDLSRDFTVAETATLYVYDLPGLPDMAVFEDGDWVLLRYYNVGASIAVENCWGIVSDYLDLTDGEQSWTWTKQRGSDGRVVRAGMRALDFGQSGDGFIKSTVLDASGSPYTDVTVWENDPSVGDNMRTMVRMGNLTGLGFSGYGLAAGNRSVVLNESGMLLTNPTTLVNLYESQAAKVGSIGMSGPDTIRILRASISEGNIFPNHSFENADISDWDDMPGADLGGQFMQTSDAAYTGDYSLLVWWTNTPVDPQPEGAASPFVSIPGAAAYVRMAIRAAESGFSALPYLSHVVFYWYNDANVYVGSNYFKVGGGSSNARVGNEWATFDGLFPKPAGATKIRILVGNPSTVPGSPYGTFGVFLDDILIASATSNVYTTLDVSSVGVDINSSFGMYEISTTPAYEPDKAHIYVKSDKLVVQYRDGATTRYKYLSLTGTGITWVHTTTAP